MTSLPHITTLRDGSGSEAPVSLSATLDSAPSRSCSQPPIHCLYLALIFLTFPWTLLLFLYSVDKGLIPVTGQECQAKRFGVQWVVFVIEDFEQRTGYLGDKKGGCITSIGGLEVHGAGYSQEPILAGKIMAPKYPGPNPWNLWIWYPT